MYIDGSVAAVPKANKEEFKKFSDFTTKLLFEFGAVRVVDTWGDDVPPGKTTDFYGAVKAKENEAIVFSWIEWPSKDVRNAAMKKMMEDPRMKDQPMPFDGLRMIYGGFESITDKTK